MREVLEKKQVQTEVNPIFFVHIPKTAGTSFRKALEQYYGKEKIVYDYGPQAAETSSIIRELIYNQASDFYPLKKWINQNQTKVISGHVHLMKYLPLTNILNTVAFFRDPVDQVISHYQHYVVDNNYKGSFEAFIKKPGVIECQSRSLSQLPFYLLGIFGITEKYSESIELINAHFGIRLPVLKLNEKKQNAPQAHEEQKNMVRERCKEEQRLYDKIKALFNNKYNAYKQGLPWVCGFYQVLVNNVIQGVSYFERNEDPVTLEIYYEQKKVAEVIANEYYRPFAFMTLPRHAFVGFRYRLNQNMNPDLIEIKVKNIEQHLIKHN